MKERSEPSRLAVVILLNGLIWLAILLKVSDKMLTNSDEIG